ncbi:hypothetical protein C8R31_101683 [Nitrosospira sp. Nsp2]|uniref:hypothetical protein n=1 Tax=Nitrosospira sp. Nsp2 TaxID=136548 RepID=UPI000D327951|nr:hypothetical protein [Nitrosospira sp. Nsp2]PTR17519.1 hypothetical protein C8R31_101683 [Nitrosospira sp. Nsp2]
MSLPDDFVIVDGLITVEQLVRRAYLIRKRFDDTSLTGPYGWVMNMVESEQANVCEIKGYLARLGFEVTGEDHHALRRIGEQLEFQLGQYDRVDNAGQFRARHEIRRHR